MIEKSAIDKALGKTDPETEKMLAKVRSMHEVNPMMGHRGVRLGITYPEISEIQFRAIFEATAELMQEGFNPQPEIMVPVTVTVNELDHQ